MARTLKNADVVTEEVVEEQVAEVVEEAKVFPYVLKHPDYLMKLTVVAESIDAGGRTVLHTADGCTYSAPKA